MKDYKKEFVDLLNEMHRDNNDGLIPSMIAEGVNECDARSSSTHLEYYVIEEVWKKSIA